MYALDCICSISFNNCNVRELTCHNSGSGTSVEVVFKHQQESSECSKYFGNRDNSPKLKFF